MRIEILEIIKPGVGFWIDLTETGVVLGIETNELNEVEITHEELGKVINCLISGFQDMNYKEIEHKKAT